MVRVSFGCRPEKMAMDSRKLVLGFLLLPLLYATFLRLSASSHPGRFKLSYWPSSLNITSGGRSGINGGEYMRLLIRRLVRGRARRELGENGVSCFSRNDHTICVTTSAVRIGTGRPIVYFSGGQNLSYGEDFEVRPYPRKNDREAMRLTAPVKLVSDTSNVPACDVTHAVPAVVFSTGGYASNLFHAINDIIIPLFITAGHFQSQVQLVVSDYRPDVFNKFRKFISHISAYDVVVASSTRTSVDKRVHCFPGAVVGVKYHNILVCNPSEAPGGVTALGFKRFLHESFSLKTIHVAPAVDKPILVLIARHKARVMLNEEEVAALADEVGFRVELAPSWRTRKVLEFAELVNSCSVLMGVHGAGLTNMVFLPSDAVVIQLVPLGLDWFAKTYYGGGVAARFGLKYVEYKTTASESSLSDRYPKDHPVLTDPRSIQRQGYKVTRRIYFSSQNITIDVSRLRSTLQQAMELLPRPSL